jgi:hypothetical protein
MTLSSTCHYDKIAMIADAPEEKGESGGMPGGGMGGMGMGM